MVEETEDALNFNLDRSNLYLEESFTDLKVGSVKRFSPVKADGSPDKERHPIFVGQTSVGAIFASAASPLALSVQPKTFPRRSSVSRRLCRPPWKNLWKRPRRCGKKSSHRSFKARVPASLCPEAAPGRRTLSALRCRNA